MERPVNGSNYHGRYLELFDDRARHRDRDPPADPKGLDSFQVTQSHQPTHNQKKKEVSITDQLERMRLDHEKFMNLLSGSNTTANNSQMMNQREVSVPETSKERTRLKELADNENKFNPEKIVDRSYKERRQVYTRDEPCLSDSRDREISYVGQTPHHASSLSQINETTAQNITADLSEDYKPQNLNATPPQAEITLDRPAGNRFVPEVIDNMQALTEDLHSPLRKHFSDIRVNSSKEKGSLTKQHRSELVRNAEGVFSRPISEKSHYRGLSITKIKSIPVTHVPLHNKRPSVALSPRSPSSRPSLPLQKPLLLPSATQGSLLSPRQSLELRKEPKIQQLMIPSSGSSRDPLPMPVFFSMDISKSSKAQPVANKSERLLPRRSSCHGITVTIAKK